MKNFLVHFYCPQRKKDISIFFFNSINIHKKSPQHPPFPLPLLLLLHISFENRQMHRSIKVQFDSSYGIHIQNNIYREKDNWLRR